ncbi:MAG: cobalt-precorrin 5A hydrolase [Clostridiales bacterium]|nr:cobalt-precorrin 5A hydrolase [Clostridiales bacterium]
MRGSIFAFSRQGCETARRIMAVCPDVRWKSFTMERFGEADFAPITPKCYGECFATSELLVFVGSCGIAVRKIAPFVHDKRTDPAVVCVDELGTFVIPLLSGHIGGANALARHIAGSLHATAVITTATDINRKFSVDTWATENGCAISSMKLAKAVSAAILEGDIPLKSDFPITGSLPNGVISGETGNLGIYLTVSDKEPFEKTLRLIPKCLHLGIGCRRGTEKEAIQKAVEQVFRENHLDFRAVRSASSIDLKKDEEGLLSFCKEQNIPIRFYSAPELEAVPGEFTPSPFVQKVTGVDNVCERAALIGAEDLIVRKTACHGVTVAVAKRKWEVHFG